MSDSTVAQFVWGELGWGPRGPQRQSPRALRPPLPRRGFLAFRVTSVTICRAREAPVGRRSKRFAGLAIAGLGVFALTVGNASVANAKLVAPDGCVSIGCPDALVLGFDANEGSCQTPVSRAFATGTWAQVPGAEDCTRPGYVLLGWNPSPDGSDPLGFDPDGWTHMTGHNTLYAIWVPAHFWQFGDGTGET